ncbi:MAG: SdiA-regulated domain-containing protein [Bacteroidales bacterium]|nr:SdiA-regulated domain-containing protein [Bacteroidales bacterium]
MRRSLILMITTAIFTVAVVSCNKTPDPNGPDTPGNTDPEKPDTPDTPDDGTLKPGTFKFVASTLQERWNAGDQIFVHGNLGSWAQTVTLKASDISADGKTASAYLEGVIEKPAEPDGLYAAWPDAAVIHGNGKLGTLTNFSSCDGLLTAAYLDGDTFNFIDVSSSLTFSVNGDYDQYAICANDRNGIIVTNFVVNHTSAGTTLTQKQNTGYPFKYGTLESGRTVKLWLPGDMTLKGGVTIFLGKNGQWPAIYSSDTDIKLEPGKTTGIGDITSGVKSYDGPEPRMPQMGNSTKFTVNFNELSGLCLSKDEDFLWTVGDNGDLAKLSFTGEVLYQFHIGGDAEGISRNPETEDLIIGLEPDGVGIVKAPGYNTRVTTLFSIPAARNYGNSGVEGLTYYKNGKVLAGAQSNSHLFLYDLASKTLIWEKKMYDKALVSEIAGLFYDPLTDWLWIIDSEARKVFVFLIGEEDGSTTLLGAYPVNGPGNPESVCVDHKNSCIWVGDDDGSTSYLYRYDFTGLDDAIKE